MKPAPTKYITTTAAARLARVSNSTMLRACEAGVVKTFRTPGGHYRVNQDSARLEFAPGSMAARQDLAAQIDDLAARVKVLEEAVRWALGDGPAPFPKSWVSRPPLWRKELRARAGLT